MSLIESNKSEQKSVVKSVRLKSYINQKLEEEAKNQNLSVNTLISKILTKYLEAYNVIEKMECVILPFEHFKDINDSVDEELIIEIGKKYGARLKNYLSYMFGRYDLSCWIKLMNFISNNTGLATISIKNEDDEYSISSRHKLGLNWSIYFKYLNEESLKELGIQPEITIDSMSVTVKFCSKSIN